MRRFSGCAILIGLGTFLIYSAVARADVVRPLTDKDFLRGAITAGRAEVKFGEIAEKRANSPMVKEFAQRMIKDHKKLNEKLMETARNMNVAVAVEFNRHVTETIDGLNRLKGNEFDRAYITRILQDHERAVKAYENEAKSATNGELKKICKDALPDLQKHLKEARKIANDLNAK